MKSWNIVAAISVCSMLAAGEESVFPKQKEEAQKGKAHFAGAKKEAVQAKAKPKKAKSPWFLSKTQPKVAKRQVEEELPDVDTLLASAKPYVAAPSQEEIYPKDGVEAPRGHLFITADWLLWRVREEGTEFATITPIEFNYSSGFRVGLGVHLPHTEAWDLYANYTNFCPSASNQVTGLVYPLFAYQGAGSSGSFVDQAKGSWHISFQTMDLAFGKSYYLSSSWSVHPFLGMKGAWIDQRAHFSYTGGYIPEGELFTTRLKNDFKGAGPLMGIDAKWHWGAGFSLLGKCSSALIAGFFENKQLQTQLGEDVIDYKKGHNLMSPTLQMLIALGWDYNWNREMCHFGVDVGFESQYFWSQNQTELFFSTLPAYQRQNGDLSLYGLTLQVRLDF